MRTPVGSGRQVRGVVYRHEDARWSRRVSAPRAYGRGRRFKRSGQGLGDDAVRQAANSYGL
jgi:hypothetical protein